MNSRDLLHRFYPESNVSGFSHADGMVTFYAQIASVLKPTDIVLDFGSGRGEPLLDDEVAFRRNLSNLQGRCARLDGCDIDDAVLEHPFLDAAKVIQVGAPLPYSDSQFDLIVARWVFEHIDDPLFTAHELIRILKPGGLIAAITPNKFGYLALSARSVPNKLHTRTLAAVQPGRKPQDVFPTRYKLNRRSTLQQTFGDSADVFVAYGSSEPAYHFGNPFLYRGVKWLDKHLPETFQPILFAYIRKKPRA
ncbi:class I SAM-dependent methyltransferase [Mycolicibacterium phocaicum]|uniref:class I SAM-dependent methyltransferase n=1 Tax=Mycolicibacterium phocaicum TaxID=319706 RepID=UPI001F45B064|nr:class I SAM-dependent methyltransferase [Mycolicibacterium phocaicum]